MKRQETIFALGAVKEMAGMQDESDVFQDFSSDGSDFGDADWDFTDGESASVLQLMDGANSTQLDRTEAISLPTVNMNPIPPTNLKATEVILKEVEEVSTKRYTDEELLDELFPESKPGVNTEVVKTTAHASNENRTRVTECEVEWALMALEEHEQLEHQSRSNSPARGVADFVSLFEEMYGGDTAIALPTPSPISRINPHESRAKSFGSKRDHDQILVKQDAACPSNKADEEIPGYIPAASLDMLKLIYNKAAEVSAYRLLVIFLIAANRGVMRNQRWMQQDLSSILYGASNRFYLPGKIAKAPTVEPISSLRSLAKSVCSLEERLNGEGIINAVAPTREERLELVIVALDDNVGALPHNLRTKWAKTIDMLPLLVKMQEQRQASVSTPKFTPDQSTALQISIETPQPKERKRSPLQRWAEFHPEKMPARRSESMKVSKASSKTKHPGQSSGSKKPRVRIRQYIPSKLRVRCKVYNPEDSELTFRPKINKKSPRKNDAYHEKEDFASRMQRDISQRISQKLQYQQKREQHDREEAESVSSVKLIAKGSERILLRNGMWAESLEERIHRLAKHHTSVALGESRSKTRRQRHEQKKRKETAIASKACESLYQRGIDQRRREQERLQEDAHDLEFQRNRPKISSRSLRVMKTRIRQELAQLCVDSQRTANAEASDEEECEGHIDSSVVTFIQFSCALLYFGFVADLNTPWGSSKDNDSKITLLWHSWTVFTRDNTGAPGDKLAVKMLERVLFSVILGRQTSEHSSLQAREVQTLLRLYRSNYCSRKHTQPKLESEGRLSNGTKVLTQGTKTGKIVQQSSSRRHRIRYSLHGKRIRDNGSPESDLLSEREQLLQEKIDEMREAKSKQELEGCTFRPHINPGPSEVATLRSTHQSSPKQVSSPTVSTFERLYSDAFQRQNNVLEKYLEAKLHREEQEKLECKVHPSYVNGLTIEERLENLHAALAGNALPVNFHKKIDAMRTAAEMKAQDEQVKERRLQPAHFKKAQDGRTIVIPFQFATEIRATLSTELKNQRAKAAHRPSNHMMKSLRPTTEEGERETPTLSSPRTKFHDHFDSNDYREADLCLDVHVSPSETRQLYLANHDDPLEVVNDFAQRFSLNNTQRHFLLQLVEARLEQFTNLQT